MSKMASEPLIVQAIYSFKGTNNDELEFQKGDKITITQKEDGGWWEGTLGDKTGWFPSNYVKEIKDASVNVGTTSNTLHKQYRAIVLKDLIDSEKAHVTEQQGLVNNFLISLEKSTILTPDEYRQLTGNMLDVLDTHQQLLKLLEEESTKASSDQKVGRLFLSWAPRIKSVHQIYCSLHPRAAFILDKFKDELTTYMESLGATSPGVLVLTIGLSKPFRRLEKYSGMLQELERHFEESHPDRGDTQRSVAIYKEISLTCSAIRRQKELELQVLTGPLRGWEGQSLSTLGDIIYMGSVAIGPQHHDRYLVLFPTTLLMLSVSPRFSAFIYEGKLPLTGIAVNRLEDNDQYKNAFEITGPLIEKRIAVCQSKEEANHWVDLLRKHMPHHSTNCTSPSSKASPSQAEIVPQPPPHLDARGYCNRTSVRLFSYNPEILQKFVLPSFSYPPAAPYANLTKLFRKLVKYKSINSRLMKKLLYPEYFNNNIDTSNVKRRWHKTEITLYPSNCCHRASYIICDSYSDTTTDSDNDSSNDEDSMLSKRKMRQRRSSNCSCDSESSNNPFGYIRYYNPQTGFEREETKYESVIDYGEVSIPNVVETSLPSKGSIVLTSTANVHLIHQVSENSEGSSFLERKPYMACEDLVNVDSNIKLSPHPKLRLFNVRQSLPSKFVADKFNKNSLTTISIPASSSDHNIICQQNFMYEPKQDGLNKQPTGAVTHSSSLDLSINSIPLPDSVTTALLYNSIDENNVTSSDNASKSLSRILIKPPTLYRNTLESNNLNKSPRRSSIQMNIDSEKSKTHNSLRRCLSYQLVQVSDPTSEVNKTCCRCMEPNHNSVRSSDSGMAGSCTFNSPEFPLEKQRSSESLNIYNQDDVDLSSLGGNILSFSEIEAIKFESQCKCTSPFDSTPRTSCQPSICENIITGSQESMRVLSTDLSTIPTPHPWESEQKIHSKLMKIRSQTITLPKQKCASPQNLEQKSRSVDCNLVDSKTEQNCDNFEAEMGKNETFKSGLYAHWWLKAKLPPEVVKGIYEDTRSPVPDVVVSSGSKSNKCRKTTRNGNKQ